MADTAPLLIEIGTEELPPKTLDELASAFAHGVCEGLKKSAIQVAVEAVKIYSTPRRLALLIPNVVLTQPSQTQERRGPALSAGVDANGQPSKALAGFAASCGVTIAQLEKLETDKGAWFVYRAQIQGQPTAALLPTIISNALKALPIAKPMRWGNHDYAFVRPVHWIVILLGQALVEGEIFGIASNRFSRGHRIHHPQPVEISKPEAYLDALRAAKVLADPLERRERIRSQVEAAAKCIGATARVRDALLNEVTNLVEWPVAIACTFDREFLKVPQEALITTMESNQKFFPVFNEAGKLTEHFIGVANLKSAQPDEIRKGYERVIRPRFADAKFFFDEDCKTPLYANCEALRKVTYQQQLGSVFDKCERVAKLCAVIAKNLGVNSANAVRAAELSKCDLMTRMVGEFPELQGVMGRYYASIGPQPESPDVAQALDEFYAPRFAGDAIASGETARILAVAERLDTLTGIFSIGQKPSGNKDPFALRRAALGLARTLIEGSMELDLKTAFIEAKKLANAHSVSENFTDELYAFVCDRLRGYYTDQGIRSDAFEAVLALAPGTLMDFNQRIHAVVAFAALPESQSLAAANKRIGNILKQADAPIETKVDPALFESDAESRLHQTMEATTTAIAPLTTDRRYVEALQILAQLREPVDVFFESVMVMADDKAKRNNRLAMLSRLRNLFLQIADISLLQTTT